MNDMSINTKIGAKLKSLRDSKGLNQRELAQKFSEIEGRKKPLTIATISKWENSESDPPFKQLNNYSILFNVTAAELFDETFYNALEEDVTPYAPPSNHPLHGMASEDHRFCFEVDENVLDQRGIMKGDIIVFDNSSNYMDSLRDGDIVIANHVEPGKSPVKILRQFVEPGQLITNSIRTFLPPLQVISGNPAIMGRMVMKSSKMIDF